MRLCVSICLVGVLVSMPLLAQPNSKKIKPVLIWTGKDSRQETRDYIRCRSTGEWTDVWLKHHGDAKEHGVPTCPIIDFDNYEVVVIYKGVSVSGLDIIDVEEVAGSVFVRFRSSWFSIAMRDGGNGKAKVQNTRSYAFIVLPITTVDIVIDQDVRGDRAGKPIWEERARLAAKRPQSP